MNLDIKKIQIILKTFPEVRLAYLIGSALTGTDRQDSDLDIVLVINKEEIKNFEKIYLLLNKVVNHENLDLRLVTEKSDIVYLFEVVNGKLLYACDEKTRVSFEKKVMLFYYDTQHVRNIFHYYLDKRIEQGTYGK